MVNRITYCWITGLICLQLSCTSSESVDDLRDDFFGETVRLLENSPELNSELVKINGKEYSGVLEIVDARTKELLEKTQIRNGEKHGASQTFIGNGILRSEVKYFKGKKQGFLTLYHSTGQKAYEAQYQNDTLHGSKTEWHPRGQLSSIKTFANGKMIKNKVYGPGGNIIANYVIKNGRKYGLVKSTFCQTDILEHPDLEILRKRTKK